MSRHLLIYLFFILPWACVGSAWASDDRAVAILRKSAQNMEQLHSVQFSAAIMSKESGVQEGQLVEYDDALTYTFANGMWRSEVWLAARQSGTNKPHHWLSLYDGIRHQMFYDSEGQLVLSDAAREPNSSLVMNPIVLPFFFLSGSQPVSSVSDLRMELNWTNAYLHASYVGQETVGTIQCEKVAIPALPPMTTGTKWNVFFAASVHHYPMKFEVISDTGKLIGFTEVLDHVVISSDSIEVVVPTVVSTVDYDATGTIHYESRCVMDSNTIKVNEDFDVDLFTIAVSRAQWVHDIDAGTHLNIGSKASIVQDSQGRWRAVLAFSVLVAIVASVVAWKRWKR